MQIGGESWEPGQWGSGPGAGTKQRAEGREIQIPVLHHGIKNIEHQYLFVSSI